MNAIRLFKDKAAKTISNENWDFWQFAIGNYAGFENLGEGHITGLDVISLSRKEIYEIKNRWNTDNKSSRTLNYSKLADFKREHPKYRCIYGVVNDKNPQGKIERLKSNGLTICYYSGNKLLCHIFGSEMHRIVMFLKGIVNHYLCPN